jgi:hypothetical protein
LGRGKRFVLALRPGRVEGEQRAEVHHRSRWNREQRHGRLSEMSSDSMRAPEGGNPVLAAVSWTAKSPYPAPGLTQHSTPHALASKPRVFSQHSKPPHSR